VLPVNPADKKNPGGRVGLNWPAKSSRDPETIVSWFAGTDDLIALHLGRSGAIAFDVDYPSTLPQVLQEAVHDDAVPYQSTRAHEPGRGHYLFAVPQGRDLGNSKGKLTGGWGEVRGRNGVIIVEPSLHENAASGARYQWQRTGPLPLLPEALSTLLPDALATTDAATDAAVRAFLDEHTEAKRPAILAGKVKGYRAKLDERESAHASAIPFLAGALREARCGFYAAADADDRLRDVFVDAVTADRPAIGGSIPKKRTPKQAAAEWSGIRAWAVAQAKAASDAELDDVRKRIGDELPDLADLVSPASGAADVVEQGSPEGSEDAAAEPGSSWGGVDLSNVVKGLLSGTLTRLAPTVGVREGGGALFYAGKVNGIAGASGSGKSWTALASCLQEMRAGNHVVYIDLEDDEVGAVGRLLDLGASPADIVSRFHYVRPDEAHRPAAHARIVALVVEHQPTLLIVDSTGESLALDGKKPNDDDDVARWFRELPAPLARLGPAVTVLDHIVKADDGGLWPIGSQRKRAAISGAQYMQSVVKPFARGQRGAAKLVCAKDRHGTYRQGQKVADLVVEPAEEGTALTFTLTAPGAAVTTEATNEFRPTTLMERVSRLLEQQSDPMSRTQVTQRLGGKKANALTALDALIAEGFVTTAPGPRNGVMCTSGRAYRQDADPRSDKYLGGRERVDELQDPQDSLGPSPTRSFRKEKERGTGQERTSESFPGTGGERVGNGSLVPSDDSFCVTCGSKLLLRQAGRVQCERCAPTARATAAAAS
jgi:hypothetical protein